jgi:CXXC-20-CXXC protein
LKLLRLPVCPHCNAVYRYNEVSNMCRYRNIECRHCKKVFTVYKTKGRVIFFTVDIAVLIVLNIVLAHFCGFTLLGLLIFTPVFFGLSLFILPFTVRFRVYDRYRERKKKKN